MLSDVEISLKDRNGNHVSYQVIFCDNIPFRNITNKTVKQAEKWFLECSKWFDIGYRMTLVSN